MRHKIKRRPFLTKRIGKKFKFHKLPSTRGKTKKRWKNLRTETHAKNTVVYKNKEVVSPDLWKGTYRDYLRSKQWRRVKYGFFLWLRKQNPGRGLRCAECDRQMKKKNRKKFAVHHLTYERLGCERHEDLRLLCNKCHDTHHDTHHGRER